RCDGTISRSTPSTWVTPLPEGLRRRKTPREGEAHHLHPLLRRCASSCPEKRIEMAAAATQGGCPTRDGGERDAHLINGLSGSKIADCSSSSSARPAVWLRG